MASDGVDYLDEDLYVPSGQRFALVSFVGPTLRQKNDKFGMKVRGCFATREEAASHVRKLQSMDGRFDIFLLEVGKWALVPPDPTEIGDVEYQESYLQDLMKGYVESQEKAKAVFAERTKVIKDEGLDKNLLPEEVITRPKDAEDDEAGPSA